MKKVFKWCYITCREPILFGLFALYTFLGISKLSNLLNLSYWKMLINVIECVIAAILIVYLVADFINHKFHITWYLLFGTICALAVVFTAGSIMLCFFLAFAYLFKDCDFKKLALLSAIVMLSSITIIACLSGFGVVENSTIMRGEIERKTLGFSSAPSMSQFFMLSTLAYNYYRQEKITIGELAYELSMIVCIFCITNTRLSFALTLLIIAWSIYLKITKGKATKLTNLFDKYNQGFSVMFASLPLMVVLGFGILVAFYDFDLAIINKLEGLLSGRISLTDRAFSESTLSLFGAKQNWTDSNGSYIGVDPGFYQYLFVYGFIPTVFIMFTMVCIYFACFQKKNYKMCFCLLILCIDFMLGNSFVDIRQNIFLLSIAFLCPEMLFGEKYQVFRFKQKSQVIQQDGGENE